MRACGSPRLLRHAQLNALAIAHVDCDAFYATIEKRDEPSLADKPLIIGGGKRGVVSTACYIARTYGIHSRCRCSRRASSARTRPSFRRHGESTSSRPRGTQADVRTHPAARAAVDRRGIHGPDRHGAPARHEPGALARALLPPRGGRHRHHRVDRAFANKFLAKIASDMDKPRGFAVLGKDEALAFLEPKPVGFIWGVGKVSAARLQRDGYDTIADLQRADETDLMKRYGVEGRRCGGSRSASTTAASIPSARGKSVSAETTFGEDIAVYKPLEKILWSLCERVSRG
jgi:DNA polymerase-4